MLAWIPIAGRPFAMAMRDVGSFAGWARGIDTGDLDDDGDLDLVANFGGCVVTALNRKDGAAFDVALTESAAGTYGTRGLTLADMQGDGHLDAVLYGSAVWFLIGSGDGRWVSREPHPAFVSNQVDVADLDADGDLDIAAAGGPVALLWNQCDDPCAADLDASGDVDAGDLLIVLGSWNLAGGAGDITGDGNVDVLDLCTVIGRWGACRRP